LSALKRRRARVVARGGFELGFAAGAAEQHVFAFPDDAMRRVGRYSHAANGVARNAVLTMAPGIAAVMSLLRLLGVH
jgi:hypothetical protein